MEWIGEGLRTGLPFDVDARLRFHRGNGRGHTTAPPVENETDPLLIFAPGFQPTSGTDHGILRRWRTRPNSN